MTPHMCTMACTVCTRTRVYKMIHLHTLNIDVTTLHPTFKFCWCAKLLAKLRHEERGCGSIMALGWWRNRHIAREVRSQKRAQVAHQRNVRAKEHGMQRPKQAVLDPMRVSHAVSPLALNSFEHAYAVWACRCLCVNNLVKGISQYMLSFGGTNTFGFRLDVQCKADLVGW